MIGLFDSAISSIWASSMPQRRKRSRAFFSRMPLLDDGIDQVLHRDQKSGLYRLPARGSFLWTIWPVWFTNSLSIRPFTRAETAFNFRSSNSTVPTVVRFLGQRLVAHWHGANAGEYYAIWRELNTADGAGGQVRSSLASPFFRLESGMKQIGHFSLLVVRSHSDASDRRTRDQGPLRPRRLADECISCSAQPDVPLHDHDADGTENEQKRSRASGTRMPQRNPRWSHCLRIGGDMGPR